MYLKYLKNTNLLQNNLEHIHFQPNVFYLKVIWSPRHSTIVYLKIFNIVLLSEFVFLFLKILPLKGGEILPKRLVENKRVLDCFVKDLYFFKRGIDILFTSDLNNKIVYL